MKNATIWTLALALGLVAMPGTANAQANVTVTLEIDSSTYPVAALQESFQCSVTVPDTAVVADVLDAAVDSGCIAAWTWFVYPTSLEYGRFVSGINGRQANCDAWTVWWVVDPINPPPACTYWGFLVDGEDSTAGVDTVTVSSGATYTLEHRIITWP